MQYTTRKVKHRIIHLPDKELMRTLRLRRESFSKICSVGTEVSTFGKPAGLVDLLSRHTRDRFFVVLDFVYAFHQITRQMVEFYLREERGLINFNDCFVELAGKQVIPIGFPTSNWIFEFFMSRAIDWQLETWQEKHNGHITRNCDNVLATWKKNNPRAFEDLRDIFEGFSVRATPKKPRKWIEPICFCGLVIPRRGSPILSRKKRREILNQARAKSEKALKGALHFLAGFDKVK